MILEEPSWHYGFQQKSVLPPLNILAGAWPGYDTSNAHECKRLKRVVDSAQFIMGAELPTIKSTYMRWCLMKVESILKDPHHLGNDLFSLLPSGRMFRSRSLTPSGSGAAAWLHHQTLETITTLIYLGKSYRLPDLPWTWLCLIMFSTNVLYFLYTFSPSCRICASFMLLCVFWVCACVRT